MPVELGVGCVLFLLPRNQGPFSLQVVGCQTNSAGSWVATLVLSNPSTRLIPTFAVSPPLLRPQPEEGEPMYWIKTGTVWRARADSAKLSFSRVVFPGSAWKFRVPLEPGEQAQRIRLTYILGRIRVPRLVDRWYNRLRGGTRPRPLSTSPQYVECDLKPANHIVSAAIRQPHP